MDASTLNDIMMESGLDLFSKINNESRQNMSNIEGLDKKLLPNLQSNSIVEISGPSRTGKTILVLQYITKSILPVKFQHIQINGLALNVLLVDMELKFSIRILIEEMEHYLNQCFEEESHKKNEQSAKQTLNNCTNQDLKTKIIQDSLSRLHVTNCHTNSDNLALIFQNIETQILSNNLTLDVVIIENFLNFYFEDISVQICSIAKYISKILTQSVLKYVKKFNIAILYTRYIQQGRGRLPSSMASHSVQLFNINYNGIHKCVVNCDQVYYYRIERQDIVWTDFKVDSVEEDCNQDDDL